MTDEERPARERSRDPAGLAPRYPGDRLEDAGPALRIEESTHPAGPAFEAQFGRRPAIVVPEEPVSPADQERRAMGARGDLALLSVLMAGLFLLAGGIFYLNGSERGDGILATAGLALLVIGAAVLLVGLALRRAD